MTFREFDWEKNKIGGSTTIKPGNHLIVEGVGLFRPELLKYFAFTIWIECPIEVAIARGKKRDRDEYGIPEN